MGRYKITFETVFRDLQLLCEKRGVVGASTSYMTLRRLFFLVLDERTENMGFSFSGPFAKMDFLVKKHKMAKSLYHGMNRLRGRLASLSSFSELELSASLMADVRLFSEFTSCAYQVAVPKELQTLLPSCADDFSRPENMPVADVMRVVVNRWDECFIYANTCGEWSEEVKICYGYQNEMGDLSVVGKILTENSQLNLIRPKVKENVYYPDFIVYEPDFLVDISTIAECFEDYGRTPLSYLIKRLMPRQQTQAILLGNIAGQFLDEELFESEQNSYGESVMRFFQENPLNVATCADFDGEAFHQEARRQQQNLRNYVKRQKEEVFDAERVLLEPSFFCDVLGVQGRVDLLSDDKRVLIEQKSGKWGYPYGGHQEKHYVQMLFYLAWLRYGLGIPHDSVNCMLLYSKYPTEGMDVSQENGLIRETPAPKLLFEAIHLRNRIAHLEVRLKDEAISLLDTLQVDELNENGREGRLWTNYQKPQIEKVLSVVQSSSPLERAYFYRFFSFVEKEYHLAKASFAESWNLSMEEKRQEGMVYAGLRLVDCVKDDEKDGVEELTFLIDKAELESTPNFRKGDVVVCYSYVVSVDGSYVKGGQNVCGDIVLRATIKEFRESTITVKLRSMQRNGSLFKSGNSIRWALEHDFIDSSFVSYFKDIFSFLDMDNSARKELILNLRKPRLDRSLALTGDYGGFNELVLKAKQALDYFVVIGPPGTGKTSFALVNILKETLLDSSASVLLVSYTNRAVEEICSKLVEEGIDFIRIGHEHSCTEGFDKSYLLKNRTKGILKVDQLRDYLQKNRVYVGTTAAVSATKNLFSLKHFDLAIVDEASQILEPHLMGLLTACDGRAIDKFVFIGDQKQLPAVVQQPAEMSVVQQPILRAVGLLDCRQSFFERILRSQGECRDFVYMLNRQGRMHPVVSEFVNKSYYDGMLESVPLQHQGKEFFYKVDESKDGGLEGMLLTKRLFWLDVKSVYDDSSDTVNLPEAKAIAEIVYKTWNLFQLQGKVFDAQQSVGVIVPYRSQIATVRRMLEKYDVPQLLDISIDTVERFQGSQRDVILYGTTVKKEYQLGFLSGNVFEENGVVVDRKLNVAVSRSREQMIVVGNVELLSHSRSYLPFISYLKEKNGVISF